MSGIIIDKLKYRSDEFSLSVFPDKDHKEQVMLINHISW